MATASGLGPQVPALDEMWWPDEPEGSLLRQAQRRIVPVTGAGFSRLDGLPLSSDLAKWMTQLPMAQGINFQQSRQEGFSYVANQIVQHGPDPKQRSLDLRKEVAEFFALDRWGASPGVAAKALVRVPSKFIVTFNYDLLLEEAARPDPDPESAGAVAPTHS